jgi:alginate O-acetyltransferase complex protein AlgI
MLFNSLEFILFLTVVYGLYRLLPFRGQNWMLLVASYLFYGWWDWRFLFLMIFSTSVDFWTGLVLDRGGLTRRQVAVPAMFLLGAAVLLIGFNPSELLHRIAGGTTGVALISPFFGKVVIGAAAMCIIAPLVYRYLIGLPEDHRRRGAMIVSIIMQLIVLGFFKYFNFFVDSLVASLQAIGVSAEPRHIHVLLPVGISFYTFQSMSYAIDIYRREIKPTDRFFDFALFVSYFPQLVAGPIQRARNLLPQMSNPRILSFDQTTRGLFLILFGLFKKIGIADGVASTVDQAFVNPDASWGTVVVGTVCFAVQIYCDFSGYSDIARGVSKLFGVELMLNFDQPYFAKSPREFWQRWHISLSTWLSDYLYKPLGGNRGSMAFTCRNLMLTMLLGGLWHGAAWNYVLWGFYHGTILSAHRVMTRRWGAASNGPIVSAIKVAAFGLVTLYGWLLVRAQSLAQVASFTQTLFTGAGGLRVDARMPMFSALLGIALLIGWELAQYNNGGDAIFYRRKPAVLVSLAIAAMIFLTFMGMSNAPAQFIYFQF